MERSSSSHQQTRIVGVACAYLVITRWTIRGECLQIVDKELRYAYDRLSQAGDFYSKSVNMG
jgi:hypothetical protein